MSHEGKVGFFRRCQFINLFPIYCSFKDGFAAGHSPFLYSIVNGYSINCPEESALIGFSELQRLYALLIWKRDEYYSGYVKSSQPDIQNFYQALDSEYFIMAIDNIISRF